MGTLSIFFIPCNIADFPSPSKQLYMIALGLPVAQPKLSLFSFSNSVPDLRSTGKCAAREAGTCPLAHDPNKVMVCSKWLQERCETLDCPLQHKLKPQLMPLCEHFDKASLIPTSHACLLHFTWSSIQY